MQAALPTLRLLLRSADKIIIVSHKGRPLAGKPVGRKAKFSLRKNGADLSRSLKWRVIFIPHFRFAEIKKQVLAAPKGSVFLLENIRFLPGETSRSPELAEILAGLADYYVNDAFAVSHRSDASVARVEKFLPSYAGLELEKEIKSLSHLRGRPRRPLVIVLGVAKVSDKLGIVTEFLKKADYFLIGGAAANTLLAMKGERVGASLRERDPRVLQGLRKLLRNPKVVLPIDVHRERNVIYDIGPRTAVKFAGILKKARTVFWSGPMGLFEKKKFAQGSLAVARAIAANRRAFSVTGGGETVRFLKQHRLDKKFSFISTGGSAMLDFLAGEELPGIAALST